MARCVVSIADQASFAEEVSLPMEDDADLDVVILPNKPARGL
jgi:hypothetical protein